MNKTININLAQIFFQIDETAFHKLKSYLDAIEKSLQQEESKEEIINDIEARIAELFIEQQANERQVITAKEVDEVIEVMGKPEDYLINDDATAGSYQKTERKPLYRDLERGYLGGVSSGLDYYLNIDAVWIRLFWVLTTLFSSGVFALIYVILWIVTPAARTTAQKIAMKGKPVNLSTIEEDIKSNYKKVSEKVKNANYDKYKKDIKTGSTKFANWSENFFSGLVKAIGKVVGVFLIIIASILFLGSLIGFVAYGGISLFGSTEINTEAFVYGIPHWIQVLSVFILSTVLMIYLIILGLKLMNPTIQQLNRSAHITLLSLLLVSIAFTTFLGIKRGIQETNDAEVTDINTIPIKSTDTLKIKMLGNLKYDEPLQFSGEKIKYNDQNEKILFSRDVKISILKSQGDQAQLSIVKESEGYSMDRARKNAASIKYDYLFEKGQLALNGYFLGLADNKNKDQELEVNLHLPENQLFELADNVSRFYYKSYNQDAINLSDSLFGHTLQLKQMNIQCLDCDTLKTNKPTKTNKS